MPLQHRVRSQPASDKSGNPGGRPGVWITVDSYLVLNEAAIHNHHNAPDQRISTHLSPTR